MKPHVTCHMVCSADGRTQTKHWPAGGINTAKIYEDSAATIKSDGWLVGRVTMSEFSSPKPRAQRAGRFTTPKTDYIAPHKEKTYAVGIDPSGKLHWEKGHVDTEHVIAVLTEKVSAEYLDHLRMAGVSYIFGGKSKLNLKRVLDKLHKHFGILRITLQGGGSNNGSFLNAGLVDALSIIILPFADGEKNTPSIFDIEPRGKTRAHATRMKLLSSKLYQKKYPWLRYKIVN